jgi:hypothetical protein
VEVAARNQLLRTRGQHAAQGLTARLEEQLRRAAVAPPAAVEEPDDEDDDGGLR